MTTYPSTDAEVIEYLQTWVDNHPEKDFNEPMIICGPKSLSTLEMLDEMRKRTEEGLLMIEMYREGFKLLSERQHVDLKVESCSLCNKRCTDEDHCFGCNHYVCSKCDVNEPMGVHEVTDHE